MWDSVIDPIVSLLNSFLTPLLAIVGAAGALYCVILGVKYAKAEAIIGYVLIFVLLLALNLSKKPLVEWLQTYTTNNVG